jgi:general secretion pathway protein A
MYETYYNLKSKPFQITTDPKFLWLGEKHAEALATLKYGILENKGFLLLTGDVGTGKTALINRLVKMIDMAAIVATIPDPGLDALDFFNILAIEFGMRKRFDSKGAFLIYLKQFLHKAYAAHKKVLLIVDECQRLAPDLLEQIRLLSNIELQNRKLINIFFVGQSEFNDTLMKERSKAVRQRITVSYHIDPLTEAETHKYIQHRLKIAGATRQIFTADAVHEIFSFSNGYPRLINIICDHALLTGYSTGLKSIDASVILECKKELQIPVEVNLENGNGQKSGTIPAVLPPAPVHVPPKSSVGKKTGVIIVLLMLLTLGGYLFYDMNTDDTPRWSMQEIAPQEYQGPAPEVHQPPKDAAETLHASKPEKQEKAATAVAAGPAPSDPNAVKAPAAQQTASEEQTTKPEPAPLTQRKFTIYFKRNSNELPDPAFETLERIAHFLQQNSTATVTIKGYTDSTGSYSYNVSVSEFRANTIKTYLAGKGINPSRIKVTGMGPQNPIAPNTTVEGRRKNRRVEIELDAEPSQSPK